MKLLSIELFGQHRGPRGQSFDSSSVRVRLERAYWDARLHAPLAEAEGPVRLAPVELFVASPARCRRIQTLWRIGWRIGGGATLKACIGAGLDFHPLRQE